MNHQTLFIGIIVTTLVILLLIAGIVISVFMANRQRLKQDIKLSQIELTYEKELRQTELEVKEQLMAQVSRELHDHVGHTLTNMRLTIENKKIDFPEVENLFKPVETLLDEASLQLRMLSRSMNSDYLNGLTFQDAIQQEVTRLQTISKMEIDYRPGTYLYPILNKDQLLMSFRIFQEILNNAIKHSGAKKLLIRSNHTDFILQVTDQGKGFNLQLMLNSGKASGLQNMKKRASLAKLDLIISTAPEKGTTVLLKIPQN